MLVLKENIGCLRLQKVSFDWLTLLQKIEKSKMVIVSLAEE